jgi:hypothetical protein
MQASGSTSAPRKTRGEIFEGIAFTFCKAATAVIFITLLSSERFVIPFIALLTATYYALAWLSGKRDTRCLLRFPWLIIGVYGLIGIGSLVMALRGREFPSLLGAL